MRQFTVIGLGEILWDVFPEHKQLGGAPANFAYISSLLGDRAIVASRIGIDVAGEEILRRLESLYLSTEYLQRDAVHPTGTVLIEVANDGQPRFEIVRDVAWDYLEWSPQWQALASTADAICFGSLAQRGTVSKETIAQFLKAAGKGTVRVFDVNLRQSFYEASTLRNSLQVADVLKLNHEEIPILVRTLGGQERDEKGSAAWFRDEFDLKLVCVTRGGQGSLLLDSRGSHEHPGYRVNVVDTVGAGDAFTATLIHHFLRGADLATMNVAANRAGAWVATQPGATPVADRKVISSALAEG